MGVIVLQNCADSLPYRRQLFVLHRLTRRLVFQATETILIAILPDSSPDAILASVILGRARLHLFLLVRMRMLLGESIADRINPR